jgi:hypothetical protein
VLVLKVVLALAGDVQFIDIFRGTVHHSILMVQTTAIHKLMNWLSVIDHALDLFDRLLRTSFIVVGPNVLAIDATDHFNWRRKFTATVNLAIESYFI